MAHPLHGSSISPVLIEPDKPIDVHDKSKPLEQNLNSLSYDEIYQKSLEILAKMPEKRTMNELKILEKLVENFAFFHKIFVKYRSIAFKLLRHLKIKILKKGRTLFFAGDLPDNFYIILRGSVFVLLPKDADAMKLERNEDSDKIRQALLRMRTEKAVSPFMKSKAATIRRISIGLVRSQSMMKDISEKFKSNMNHYYKKEISMDFEINDFDKPWLYFDEGVFKFHCINVLGAGRSFGELGLLIKKPRNATILCKEDTWFLYLEKNDYMTLEQINREKIMKKLKFFSNFFFKDRVTQDYVLKMIYNFQKRKMGYGQKLFHENDEIDGCYVIKKGMVVIKKKIAQKIDEKQKKNVEKGIESSLRNFVRKDRNKEECSEIELAMFEKGQFVGEDDIIEGNTIRSYSAISKSADLVVFFIQKDLLLQILKDKPRLLEFFNSITSDKHSYLTNKITTIGESKRKLSFSKPVQTTPTELVRTEEEDLDNLHYPENSEKSTHLNMKSSIRSMTESMKSSSDKFLKRGGIYLFGSISTMKQMGGFLRGKLFENIDENHIEVNSIKTQKEKILDVIIKNQNTPPKEPTTFSFTPNDTRARRSSMIRSPFNKYSFIRINDKDRKIMDNGEKKENSPKNNKKHNKSDNSILHIQKRIQSAMPSRSSSHQRIKSASSIYRKTGGFLTSPSRILTIPHTRCKSSAELKNLIGLSSFNKTERFSNEKQEKGNKSFGDSINNLIHQNANLGKGRLWSGSIHRTKHNMFFFIKKS